MTLYTSLLRPLLFKLDPEVAHHVAVEACRWAGAVPGLPGLVRSSLAVRDSRLQLEVAGLRFQHPLGLAAGWDKSGRGLKMLDSLGFAFAEIGSVSARPSRGNPRPRLFRLPSERAIIVNYGLPNEGAEVVASRLAGHRPRQPLGVNIVKTNDGPDAPACSPDDILDDYQRSMQLLHVHADYIALNLSCPNAAGGQDFFAQPGNIRRLLERLSGIGIECPVILKIAPRDEVAEHERILAECEPFSFIRGFCFNLPSGKPASLNFVASAGSYDDRPGAVAGKPVEALINDCIAGMYARMDRGRYIIVGAGGVFTAEDAYRKIRLGASLVQLYTALIYQGPGVVKRICGGLVELLERDGLGNIADAVGVLVAWPPRPSVGSRT